MITFHLTQLDRGPEAQQAFLVEFDTVEEGDHITVLMEAAKLYGERNRKYKDNWRRAGWRGQLVRIRERAERLWDYWWDLDLGEHRRWSLDTDDALDLINFAAFFVRGVRGETTRDGEWW